MAPSTPTNPYYCQATFSRHITRASPQVVEVEGGEEGTAQLRPLRLAKRPADFVSGGNRPPSPFALSSAFEEAAPEAELPQNSWWLKSDGSYRAGGALLYPLNEVVDERYSVYWDLE